MSSNKEYLNRSESIPKFKGTKEHYQVFMIRFTAYEGKKGISSATAVDHGDKLCTEVEFALKEKSSTDTTSGLVTQVALTTAEEKLFEDNATSYFKMMNCLQDDLIIPMTNAAGPKKSMFLVKEWLKTSFGTHNAVDSYQELSKKLKSATPQDFTTPLLFLSALEDYSQKLQVIDVKYGMDELQLKTEVLEKISSDSESKWNIFKSEYRKNQMVETTSWSDFKIHFTREWDAIGAPDGSGEHEGAGDKSLNVKVQGAKYFPGKCSTCGLKGHKSHDCPDKKSNGGRGGSRGGRGGRGRGGGKGGSYTFNGTCFECNEKGHMARDCPKKEKNKNKTKDKDDDQDEEVTLRVCTECVESDTEEVCDLAQQCDDAFFDTFGVIEDADISHKPFLWYDWNEEESEEGSEMTDEDLKDWQTVMTVATVEEDDCPVFTPRNQEDIQSDDESVDGQVMAVGDEKPVMHLLLDSGSTIHTVRSTAGMRNVRRSNKIVKVATEDKTMATAVGDLPFTCGTDEIPVLLTDVYVLPDFSNDIVSLTRLMKKGCHLEASDGSEISVKCPNGKILLFSRNSKDQLYYMQAELYDKSPRVMATGEEPGGVGLKKAPQKANGKDKGWITKLKPINVNKAHALLDHPGEKALQLTAKQFGWKLTGAPKVCEACIKAKATAKGTAKTTKKVATKPGERLHLDLSGPYKETKGHNRYHGMVVDQHTSRFWSYFHKTKLDFEEDLIKLFEWLTAIKFPPKYLRLDNAGEWKHLHKLCRKFGVVMEYTAPHTPQFNGPVERAFPTVRNMAFASLMASDFSASEQKVQWANALQDATICRNLMPRGEFANAYKPFDEDPPVQPQHLMKFGAKGWMTIRTTMKTKWVPKAEEIRRIGYSLLHSSDTYLVKKVSNGRSVESRDVTWEEKRRADAREPILKATALKNTRFQLEDDHDDDDDDDEEAKQLRRDDDDDAESVIPDADDPIEVEDDDDDPDEPPAAPRKKLSKVQREMHKLNTFFNDTATVDFARHAERVFNVSVNSDPGNPKNDHEAMTCAESKQWFQGTMDEYDGFFKLGTWKVKKRKDVTLKMNPLTTKNVYKKKLNLLTKAQRWKVRNVVRGFNMIQGVHYEESFAPTPSAQSVRTVFAISLYFLQELGIVDLKEAIKEWDPGFLIDVVQAFLNSVMTGEPVYVTLPFLWEEYCKRRGLEYDPTDLIQLMKAQYGQVDAAKRWMDMFIRILTEPGGCELTQCKTDPCVLYKHDENGKLTALMVLYVDDGFCAGDPKVLKSIRDHLKTKVEITEIGMIDTHLGVDYELKMDKHGWFFECSMTKYIADIVKDFEEHVSSETKNFDTPAAPSTILMKFDGEAIDESGYRKFVGRILYAVTKVLPDCCNAIRDLTSHLATPGEEHWNALTRLVGHLKYNYKPMKLRAPIELRTIAAFDADWATDKNDRRSVSSHLTTIGGTALVNWQAKKQTTVALSSCEAEIMAGTVAAQDVLFENNLLQEILGRRPKMPSYVYGDNQASLHIATNNALGQRTKHIDLRDKFLGELVKSGDVEVRHIRSEDNPADVNSKNTKVATHQKHAKKLYEGFILANPIEEDVALTNG